ncbi:hypothetical protein ACFFHJ_35550, partial [Planotetraspora thailandica]|uniref:hypothetical protein n=1 Tax=Planotetraspora thailandica TaxID=487172 RepID=UPI0035E551A3
MGFAAGEVRVQISTLMHLDDFPAELAGWGPIHAPLARRLAKAQINGEWRFAVCDDDGRLLFAGITRHRPAGWPRHPAPGSTSSSIGPTTGPTTGPMPGSAPGWISGRQAGRGSVRRRGIVELQIPLALLRQWQSDLPALGGWARLITDILRQLDHPDIHPGTGQGGVSGGEAATGPVISPA